MRFAAVNPPKLMEKTVEVMGLELNFVFQYIDTFSRVAACESSIIPRNLYRDTGTSSIGFYGSLIAALIRSESRRYDLILVT